MNKKKPTYEELLARHEKQARYQAVTNTKQRLQAEWAKSHGCPVDKKETEFYLDLAEPLRQTLTLQQIIDFSKSWNEEEEATAHAVAMLEKESNKASEEDETVPEEEDGQEKEDAESLYEQLTHDKEPGA